MSLAKKCDRCGVYYDFCENNSLGVAMERFARAASGYAGVDGKAKQIETLLDLCPKCSDSLRDWLKECK